MAGEERKSGEKLHLLFPILWFCGVGLAVVAFAHLGSREKLHVTIASPEAKGFPVVIRITGAPDDVQIMVNGKAVGVLRYSQDKTCATVEGVFASPDRPTEIAVQNSWNAKSTVLFSATGPRWVGIRNGPSHINVEVSENMIGFL